MGAAAENAPQAPAEAGEHSFWVLLAGYAAMALTAPLLWQATRVAAPLPPGDFNTAGTHFILVYLFMVWISAGIALPFHVIWRLALLRLSRRWPALNAPLAFAVSGLAGGLCAMVLLVLPYRFSLIRDYDLDLRGAVIGAAAGLICWYTERAMRRHLANHRPGRGMTRRGFLAIAAGYGAAALAVPVFFAVTSLIAPLYARLLFVPPVIFFPVTGVMTALFVFPGFVLARTLLWQIDLHWPGRAAWGQALPFAFCGMILGLLTGALMEAPDRYALELRGAAVGLCAGLVCWYTERAVRRRQAAAQRGNTCT